MSIIIKCPSCRQHTMSRQKAIGYSRHDGARNQFWWKCSNEQCSIMYTTRKAAKEKSDWYRANTVGGRFRRGLFSKYEWRRKESRIVSEARKRKGGK